MMPSEIINPMVIPNDSIIPPTIGSRGMAKRLEIEGISEYTLFRLFEGTRSRTIRMNSVLMKGMNILTVIVMINSRPIVPIQLNPAFMGNTISRTPTEINSRVP